MGHRATGPASAIHRVIEGRRGAPWRTRTGTTRATLRAVSEQALSAPAPRREQLRDIGLFGGLSDATLDELISELRTWQIGPGTFIMREGETAREMFVVLGGELEVLKRSQHGTDARVAMLGPGDWVGEMSIIDVMPRSASVRSLAPSLLLRIAAEDMDRLYRRDVKSYALFILNIARELSRRLRVADGILSGVITTVWDQYLAPARFGPKQPG